MTADDAAAEFVAEVEDGARRTATYTLLDLEDALASALQLLASAAKVELSGELPDSPERREGILRALAVAPARVRAAWAEARS